jgi:hypothetical protein
MSQSNQAPMKTIEMICTRYADMKAAFWDFHLRGRLSHALAFFLGNCGKMYADEGDKRSMGGKRKIGLELLTIVEQRWLNLKDITLITNF